jgi:hypothetical protein
MEYVIGQIVLWAGLTFVGVAIPLQILDTWKRKARGPSLYLIVPSLVTFASRALYTLIRHEYVIMIPDAIAVIGTGILFLQWLKYPNPPSVNR